MVSYFWEIMKEREICWSQHTFIFFMLVLLFALHALQQNIWSKGEDLNSDGTELLQLNTAIVSVTHADNSAPALEIILTGLLPICWWLTWGSPTVWLFCNACRYNSFLPICFCVKRDRLACFCFQAFALHLEALVPVHIGYLFALSLQIVTAGAKQGSKKVARNKAWYWMMQMPTKH